MTRPRRRQDGTLRPAVRRYRLRKRAEATGVPFIDPLHEELFKAHVLPGTLIWAGATMREQTGLDQEELGAVLELLAGDARWHKLRDSSGVVRAIGMPVNHPRRDDRTRTQLRRGMIVLIAELGRRRAEAAAA